MVDLAARNGASQASLEHLEGALIVALQSWATKNDIFTMIELKVAGHESTFQNRMPGFPEDDPDIVYDAVPPGLIDIPSATRKYNVHRRTIHSWVEKGHVRLRGRLKGPAKGGGYLLVREDELTAYLTAPRKKGGRPSIK